MKKTFIIAAFVALLTVASSVNAQWFRLGSGCQSGQCGRYTYSPYYSTGCANGRCGTYNYSSCPNGQCNTTPPTQDYQPSQPSCSNESCSIQSETSTYDLSDKLEVTYTRAKVNCQGCGLLLGFPIDENAIWECPKCKRQYATKDGGVYNVVKKSDEGYLVNNGKPVAKCSSDVVTKKRATTPCSTLLSAINSIRTRYGLHSLVLDSQLESGSYKQANYCSRIGRLQHASGVAEILAQNHQGLETAINQWLNSPGHRSLLLSGSFRYAGVAVVRDHYGRVWCAVQFR